MNADREVVMEVSDTQLREMFDAYAGPEGAQTRRRSGRSRRLFAASAAVTLALAATLAVFAYDRSGGSPSTGGLTRIEAKPGLSAPFRSVSLDELIARSDRIFVGTVTAIQGPEELSPANPPDYPDPILAYRVSFEPERVFRGADEGQVPITDPAYIREPAGRAAGFAAEVGAKYLVFAEWTNAGYEHVPVLVPIGIDLGVFRLIGPNAAQNSRAVVVELDKVAELVDAASAS